MTNLDNIESIKIGGNGLQSDGKIPTIDHNPVYVRTDRPFFKPKLPKLWNSNNSADETGRSIVLRTNLPFFNNSASQFQLPFLPPTRNHEPFASAVTSMLTYPTKPHQKSKNKSDHAVSVQRNN